MFLGHWGSGRSRNCRGQSRDSDSGKLTWRWWLRQKHLCLCSTRRIHTPPIRRAPIEIPERMIWGGPWSKFLRFQAQYPHSAGSPWQLPHWSCLTIGVPHLQSCLKRGLSKIQFQFKSPSHSCFFYLRMKCQPTMAWSASFCSLLVCCSLQSWTFKHSLQCQLSLLRGTCFPNPHQVLSIIPSRSGGRLL